MNLHGSCRCTSGYGHDVRDGVKESSAVRYEAAIDHFRKLPRVRRAGMLEDTDADECVTAPGDVSMIALDEPDPL